MEEAKTSEAHQGRPLGNLQPTTTIPSERFMGPGVSGSDDADDAVRRCAPPFEGPKGLGRGGEGRGGSLSFLLFSY